MNTVRLNLEDKQDWRKLQHILNSFASDYMDLVAAEQTEFKFEQQVLSITFTLISTNSDRDRLNAFTQNIDRYFNRIQLLGVRRIEWGFYLIGEAITVLAQERDIPLVSAPAPLPQTIAAAQRTSRITIRDPRVVLEIVRTTAIAKFNDTIQWVDTFPWETWTKGKAQQIKRRHQRNLVRAVIEDVLVLGVMLIGLWGLTESLSSSTINLALLPSRHFDNNITTAQYRCGNPAISLKNYVCLGRGMRYNQVASILGTEGKPLGINHNYGDRAVIISWASKDLVMNATFVDDKLVTRAYRQLIANN